MPKNKLIAIAANDARGLGGEVSARLVRCPCYVMVEQGSQTPGVVRVVLNPLYGRHQHHQRMLLRLLHEQGVNVVLAGGIGPRAIQMFHSYGITVVTGASGNVGKVLEAYLRGELRGIAPCAYDHPESCGQHGPQMEICHG